MAYEQENPEAASRSSVLSMAVAETARHLDIGPTDLGKIIGVSQPVASRLLNGHYTIKEGSKEWELGALFIRMYRGLFSLVGNSDPLAKGWLRPIGRALRKQRLFGASQNVQGLVQACEYIDAHRASV